MEAFFPPIMVKYECNHITLLKFNLILSELSRQYIGYCDECLSNNCIQGYCLVCQTNFCKEHLKKHICEYNHLTILLKNGQLMCLQCRQSIAPESYDQSIETFIYESIKLYNCQDSNLYNFQQLLNEFSAAIIQKQQGYKNDGTNAFSRKRDGLGEEDNKSLYDDLTSITTQSLLDQSLSFSQNMTKSQTRNSNQFNNPLFQSNLNDQSANTSISSYFNVQDQSEKKFMSIQFSERISDYFQQLFQHPIECYKISSKQKLNKRYVYLVSKQFDRSSSDLNERLKQMSPDVAKSFYIAWNNMNVQYVKLKDNVSKLFISEIQSMTKNKDTNTFHSYLEKTKQNKAQHEALSFLTLQRTLDFTFKSQEDRKCLEFCIKYILSKIYQ